ncbi:F-type H+-transporting ATPase subunit a [Thermoactinomyces sp. DSM 45891]|uniref:F0F1 ATP synthase subunit A n=1 Tax=Thermoactinomyces sp. DSM 45891 TaxID=1761907 RepID=UPI00091B8ADD|nr:F0F1 ATP synthase subunit A [Thermoactinomyces sp. DSM 45891]SFX63225.1 F-type H+-transporting ATPase subunit a [Thermoactinomyces sp. DSM 45891]
MEITPKVTVAGLTFDLTIILATLLASVVVYGLVYFATRKVSMVPRGLQAGMEMVVDLIRGITEMTYDRKRAEKFVAFSITLFLFVLVANQIGVILMIASEVHSPIPALGITADKFHDGAAHVAWLKSPTADIGFAFTMAIAIALFANYMGIKTSFSNWIKPFRNPLHIVEELAKPTTHAMRLWANIFAGEILITILLTKFNPLVTALPVGVWIGFSLFVGMIQAYIFTVLANVYIGQKISGH